MQRFFCRKIQSIHNHNVQRNILMETVFQWNSCKIFIRLLHWLQSKHFNHPFKRLNLHADSDEFQRKNARMWMENILMNPVIRAEFSQMWNRTIKVCFGVRFKVSMFASKQKKTTSRYSNCKFTQFVTALHADDTYRTQYKRFENAHCTIILQFLLDDKSPEMFMSTWNSICSVWICISCSVWICKKKANHSIQTSIWKNKEYSHALLLKKNHFYGQS